MEKEKNRQQFNVLIPNELLVAIEKKKTEILQQTAQKIKNQEIALQALIMWLSIDGLGLKEAVRKAKIEKAKVIMESQIKGKQFEITLSGEGTAEAFRSLKNAVEGRS